MTDNILSLVNKSNQLTADRFEKYFGVSPECVTDCCVYDPHGGSLDETLVDLKYGENPPSKVEVYQKYIQKNSWRPSQVAYHAIQLMRNLPSDETTDAVLFRRLNQMAAGFNRGLANQRRTQDYGNNTFIAGFALSRPRTPKQKYLGGDPVETFVLRFKAINLLEGVRKSDFFPITNTLPVFVNLSDNGQSLTTLYNGLHELYHDRPWNYDLPGRPKRQRFPKMDEFSQFIHGSIDGSVSTMNCKMDAITFD